MDPLVLQHLRCAVCADYFANPHSFAGCGHTFCFACASEWLRRSPSCPTCRRAAPRFSPTLAPNRECANLVELVALPHLDEEELAAHRERQSANRAPEEPDPTAEARTGEPECEPREDDALSRAVGEFIRALESAPPMLGSRVTALTLWGERS